MLRELEPIDREEIVSRFGNAIESGADNNTLKILRAELRAKFCPEKYTPQQVDATCSQVIIQRNRRMRALLGGTTPTTSDERPKDVAQHMVVETNPPVSSPTGTISNEHDNTIVVDDNETNNASATIAAVEQRVITGEHVDYDNETKNKWREEWRKYLESNTDPAKRAQMKVLCLPGKRCLEIPLYLAMGFDPKNIVGVEGGDEEARSKFQTNAARFGIDLRVGRLEKLMIDDNTPYDVISLDFHGPISELATVIMQRILPAEKAVVMVNLLQRRENGLVQNALSLMKDHYDGGYEDMYRTYAQEIEAEFVGTVDEKYRELNRKMSEHYTNAKPENLDEARDVYAHKITIQSIGVRKIDRWMIKDDFSINFLPPNDRKVPDPVFHFRNIFGNAFARTISNLFAELFRNFKFDHSRCKLESLQTAEFMIDTLMSRTHITDLRKIKYKSESKQGAPFYTDMAVIETPIEHYRSLHETAQFFKDITVGVMGNSEAILEQGKDFGVWLRMRNGALAQQGREVSNNDRIVLILDGQTIASIKVGQLLKDFEKHQRFKEPMRKKRFEHDQLARRVIGDTD